MWLPLVFAVQLSLPGCADNVCLEKRSDGWLWLTSRATETRTAVVNLPPRCATRREAPPLIPVSPGDEVRIANLNRNCSEATLHHNRGVPIDQVQDVVYQTPIARGYRYEITQGSGRRTSHARWEANATDFAYEEFKDNYAQEASIKRINTVEEVAAVALLLASDLGGGINGAILPVEGGTAL